MDNYKKVRSVLLQLQIIGNGQYDDAVSAIQMTLPPDQPYTATNENVLYANAILNDILQKEGKKGSKGVGKYMDKFPDKFIGTDEADDFINEPKFEPTILHNSPRENIVDNSELFVGIL